MSERLRELSVIAEHNEEVALQLKSERFLTDGDMVNGVDRSFYERASDIADSYLANAAPKADEETISKLAEEVDF